MRLRPILSLTVVAAATALVLTGCSSSAGETAPTSTPTPQATTLCEAVAPAGDAVDKFTATGDFGAAPTVEIPAPVEITEMQSKTLITGDGAEITDKDLVQYAISVYAAADGSLQGQQGYKQDAAAPAKIPVASLLARGIGCAPVGSRVVFSMPANEQGPAAFYLIDVLGVTPITAWGADQPPVEGMPTVTLAEDGRPTVTIPQTDAPADVKLATLKEGDGAVVKSGDNVTVQYLGVKWSDGTEFDSSWSREATPTSFPTTGVVDGFRQALEGYKVGSQVLVVVPPAFGYGTSPGHALEKETLVFVVDILATSPAAG